MLNQHLYKNLNRTHKLTVYNYSMVIKETIKLDFISDRTTNIDFVTYPDYFLMIWQYQKGNVTYCKAAKMGCVKRNCICLCIVVCHDNLPRAILVLRVDVVILDFLPNLAINRDPCLPGVPKSEQRVLGV